MLELLYIQVLKSFLERNILQRVIIYNKNLLGDIWSIGIIYYEMLTGTTPWHCKTIDELINSILT